MRYKPGDKVRINAELVELQGIGIGYNMRSLCGCILTLAEPHSRASTWYVKENAWVWDEQWFGKVKKFPSVERIKNDMLKMSV